MTERPLHPDDWFANITSSTGVDFSYQTGSHAEQFTILETVGGGVGLVDYDLDGQLDLFCVGGGDIDSSTALPHGIPSALYQQRSGKFVNVSTNSAIGVDTGYSHACVCGDINSDGFSDVILTGYGQISLFMNQGDGTFTEESDANGVTLDKWSTAAAFADVDQDGLLDLFVAGYVDWKPDPTENCSNGDSIRDVCPPQRYAPLPDHLLLNDGQGGFLDCSAQCGLRTNGKGLGVVAADFDRDQRIDFYVANDVVGNHYYTKWDGVRFQEIGEVSGAGLNDVGSPEGSMGIAVADVDGDQQLDMFVTNFELEDNSLYQNLSSNTFLHTTSKFGLGTQGRQQVGFGTGFADFNSDGWPDLYTLNGHVLYRNGKAPFQQPAFLYQNHNGQRFVRIENNTGPWFTKPHTARGGAVGDLNNDGTPDLVVSELDRPVTVLKNQLPAPNWIRLKLVGSESPRHPVGTYVSINAFDREVTQALVSGAGFFSHSDDRLLFALESNRSQVAAKVTWISGRQEVFHELQVRQDHVIIEGHGTQIKEKQATDSQSP